jgi:hypothetical protein
MADTYRVEFTRRDSDSVGVATRQATLDEARDLTRALRGLSHIKSVITIKADSR